jgi:signal transduction histidine kinase
MDALHSTEKLFLDAKRHTDEFLATLGHEMRNPLSTLSNGLELLGRSLHDPVEIESLREVMVRQVEQLMHLCDDLLDVARIAQGKLKLLAEPTGLRELIERACEQVRPFVDRCGHALTIRLPAEPVVVNVDSSRLVQVFANLIQNAAKFTDKNGHLSVTIEPQEGAAVVRVRDNGRGFDEQALPAIFEAFTQSPGTGPLPNDGLGIGLRLVKTIVELHGGTVAAHSDGVGRGSEFLVRLPVVSVPASTLRDAT